MRGRFSRQPGAGAYRRTPLPAGRLPWRQARYCAVDLELSGLDPRRDEILSFAAVPIEDGRVQPGNALTGRVRPVRAISASSTHVHGLRAADLADAPPLAVAIDDLLAAIAGRIPVVHVARVERGFLGAALRRHGVRLRRPMIDTSVLGVLWLHERDHREPRDVSLGDLAGALGLPVHAPHDALGDALTTAQVFIALAMHLDACRPETVGSLTHAQRRLDSLLAYPTR